MQLKKNITAVMLMVFSIFAINLYVPKAYSYVEAQIARQVGETFNNEVDCMAKNLYWESASESYEGKLAVANVVLNRANSEKFPKTICEVVYQKINNTYQFSWVGEKNKNIMNKYAWQECVIVARMSLMQQNLHDTIHKTKAMYYHNTSVNPGWKLRRVAQIGNHIFYSDK